VSATGGRSGSDASRPWPVWAIALIVPALTKLVEAVALLK